MGFAGVRTERQAPALVAVRRAATESLRCTPATVASRKVNAPTPEFLGTAPSATTLRAKIRCVTDSLLASNARPATPPEGPASDRRKRTAYWLARLATYTGKHGPGVVRMGNLLCAARQHLNDDGWKQFQAGLFQGLYRTSISERQWPLWESRVRKMALTAERYGYALTLHTLRQSSYLRVMARRRAPGQRAATARVPTQPGKVWCLLCCNYYPRSQTNGEHVPPRCLGGIRRARTCRRCNALTGIYDNYTAQSARASSIPAEIEVRIALRPLTAKDGVRTSDAGLKIIVDIDPEPEWQVVPVPKKNVDTLQDDRNTLSLLRPGAGQKLGLPVPPGSPFLVRICTPDYVTSYVKAAYCLVVLLLGRLGPSYARWCGAIRDLLSGTGQYEGEPRTAGGDVGRYVPVVDNPWPDKAEKVGFSLRHRLWLVIVKDKLVVLPSYDPGRSCLAALFLRSQFLPLSDNTWPASQQLAPRDPEHIRWFGYPRGYGSNDVNYIGIPSGKEYPFTGADDIVGSVIRAPAAHQERTTANAPCRKSRYAHYVVLHQVGRSLAVAEVKAETWRDFCFDWATRGFDQRDFDRPYPSVPSQELPNGVAQNKPFGMRQHYPYKMVR